MKQTEEVFVPVHDPYFGERGGYLVSNLGIIKNKWGRILKPHKTPNGYHQICLHRFGYKEWFYIHHLVARAHIGPPESSSHQINHKDKNRANNSVENLEWVTASENIKHAYSYGHHSKRRFTEAQKLEMVELRRQGLSCQKIADRFGCSRMSAWRNSGRALSTNN